MIKAKRNKIRKLIQSMLVTSKKLLYSYQEGYIGKNIFQVTLQDGTTKVCEQITKKNGQGDAVVIIPVTQYGDYLMIVESRPNTEETVAIEFPAGMVDEGEYPIDAAQRELLEETGYISEKYSLVERHYQDQGCSSAVITTYLAEGCKKVQGQCLDADENIAVVPMNDEEVMTLLKEDEYIKDANTKLAIMSLALKKRGIL